MFDFSRVGSSLDDVLNSKTIAAIYSNPLFTALVAAMLVFIVFRYVLEDSLDLQAEGVVALVIIFGASLILYSRVLTREMRAANSNAGVNSILGAMRTGAGDDHVHMQAPMSDTMAAPSPSMSIPDMFGSTSLNNDITSSSGWPAL